MKATASMGTHRRSAATSTLLAVTIVMLALLGAIYLLSGQPDLANPATHFPDANGGASPPLGGLGAMALPPSL